MLRAKLEQYLNAGWANRFWYEESNASLTEWAQANGISPQYLTAICGIFSPRVQVARNVRLAKLYAIQRRNFPGDLVTMPGAMGQRVRAADTYHNTGHIGGVKVNAFVDSLNLKPGAICIDIHMSSMCGYVKGELMLNTKKWAAKRAQFGRIIARLAKRHNCHTFNIQAALWVGFLRIERNYSGRRAGGMDWSEE